MLRTYTIALAAALIATPTLAATKWEHKTKTSTSWTIAGTINNGQLTMRGGTCKTKTSTASKVAGNCVYQTGYCSKGSRVKVTVLLSNGTVTKTRASGSCNGGRF